MANKRMLSKKIVCSDCFIMMSLPAQALYFQLCMSADDDGIVNNPLTIARSIGATNINLEELIETRFILSLEQDGIVIKHWRIHNVISTKYYTPSLYNAKLAKMIYLKPNGAYTLDSKQGRAIYKALKAEEVVTLKEDVNEMFNAFWLAYPRKVGKEKCQRWFAIHKITKSLIEKMISKIEILKSSKQWITDEGKFIPYPYTWLNRGGWEDEVEFTNKIQTEIRIQKKEMTDDELDRILNGMQYGNLSTTKTR